jgi:hypothetical protein
MFWASRFVVGFAHSSRRAIRSSTAVPFGKRRHVRYYPSRLRPSAAYAGIKYASIKYLILKPRSSDTRREAAHGGSPKTPKTESI